MTEHPTRKPVIGHVLHRLYLAGAEVLAAALARCLQDQYTFAFFCLDEIGPLGRQLEGEGFEVVDLGRKPGVDWSVAGRLRDACKRLNVDLLHAHQYTPFFYASLSRQLRSTPRVLFTEHGRHWPDRRRLKRVYANKLLLRNTDRVTAVGHFVKKALVDNEGIAPDRIQVVHNGIDPAPYMTLNGDQTLRGKVRHELGLADDEPVVIQVARFHPVKDHPTGLKGFAGALATVPRARLLLVGDGDRRDDILENINNLNISERVTLLGVRDDIPRLMAAADVFMLSSVSEGISVTLLEAMAAGLPIAATDVGGNSEVVQHGQTGLLSPRADSIALAQNLQNLLTDAQIRQSFGQTARERLMNQFTQDRMHNAYSSIYSQIT